MRNVVYSGPIANYDIAVSNRRMPDSFPVISCKLLALTAMMMPLPINHYLFQFMNAHFSVCLRAGEENFASGFGTIMVKNFTKIKPFSEK